MPVAFHSIHRVGAGALVLLALTVLMGRRAHTEARPGASWFGSPQSNAADGLVLRSERMLMGTTFKISIWAQGEQKKTAAQALGDAFDRIADLEEKISSWKPTSETSALNRAAGGDAITISRELHGLIAASLEWSKRTDGAFDITGGPLFELWEEARSESVLPTPAEVQQRLELVGHRYVNLSDRSARLAKQGMKIGFGAIGKGYAADRAAEFLRSRQLFDFIIDSGGDMVVSGTRGGVSWQVAVRHPRGEGYLAVISGTDFAVATSGDYERYFVVDGKRYSHILNLRSGWPVSDVAGVTVISKRATDADAIATTLCGLDPEQRMPFVESLPDTEAMIVSAESEIQLSNGLRLEDGVLATVGGSGEKR